MKFSSIAACGLLSVAAVVTTQPWSARKLSPCALEVQVASDHSGLVQLYYDSGAGINEPDSSVQPITAGRPALLRFALPYGRIRALRFDPLDRDVRMTLSDARIVDGSGRTLLALPPGAFLPQFQIERLQTRGKDLVVETAPGGFDPQLQVKMDGPLILPRPFWWRPVAKLFACLVVLLFACEWAAASHALRLGRRARSLWKVAGDSPRRAVLAAALLGMLVANYPVVFAGKSLVAPNLGVALLYGQNPWLPGVRSADVGDAHKADVAPLLWHHLPLSMIERRALLRDGEMPLWNRYDSAGSPLLGQGQSCFGDPLQVLPILANGAAWAWDLKFLLAKWLFAFGVGLCVLRAFRHLPSALAMAVSASFVGFFVFRVNHPAIFSFCYSPWILYFWLRCADSTSFRSGVFSLAALVGANWMEMNSGTAKEAYGLLFAMNFTGACVLLASARTVVAKLKMIGGALAAGAVFLMIGAPVWVTFFHELKISYTSYNAPVAFQLQPGMLIGLFDEAFYRPFQLELGVINPAANFFVLIGVAWALVRWRSLIANRAALGLFIASLPALALAFGVVPPAFIVRVPFLGNLLHVDNVFSCGLIVVYAVLAGFGWREAWERLGTHEGRREMWAVVVLMVVLFAAYIGTAQAVVRSAYWDRTWGHFITLPPFIEGYGWSLIAASAVLLGCLRAALVRGAPTPALAILAVTAFGAFHWREGLRTGTGFADYVVAPTSRVDLKADSPTIDALRDARDTPFRVIGFHNDLLPGWSIVYDLEGISGPDALVNPYYREFMDAAGVPRVWDWRYIVEQTDLAALKPILDALNVRFYVAYHESADLTGKYLLRFYSGDMDAFESASVWPRAFFTDGAAVYANPAQLCSWIKAGDGRPFAAIQRDDWARLSPVPRVSGDLRIRRIRAARDYRLTADTTSFTVSAPGPGFIVLSEAYEKDNFRATLNGVRVPYLRVNHAFKGIYVDAAGTYQVAFTYRPRGFAATLGLCGAGLGILGLALGAALLSRGRPAGSAW